MYISQIYSGTSTLFSFSLLSLSLIKSFSFLADKLTLGKASSELHEVVGPALSIEFRKLYRT